MLDLVEARHHFEVTLAGSAAQKSDEAGVPDLRSLLATAQRDGDEAGLYRAGDGAVWGASIRASRSELVLFEQPVETAAAVDLGWQCGGHGEWVGLASGARRSRLRCGRCAL